MRTGLLYISQLIFKIIPETRCFRLKRFLLRVSGVSLGRNVRVCSSVRILGNRNLQIGENTWIGHGTMIVCSETVSIGANVNIAPLCYIGTGTHEITPDGDSIAGRGVSSPVIIKDGVWLCARSTVLAGSVIGAKSIVAAGALVKGKVEDFELVGGIPAKHIKYIIQDERA